MVAICLLAQLKVMIEREKERKKVQIHSKINKVKR